MKTKRFVVQRNSIRKTTDNKNNQNYEHVNKLMQSNKNENIVQTKQDRNNK